jgi:GAF domain-containing protein
VSQDSAAHEDLEATVARQAEEIAGLRRELGNERLAHRLRDAVRLAAAVDTISSATTQGSALGITLEVAATILRARAASVLLLDEDAQELVVEHAIRPEGATVRSVRVPLGQGIAGLVALSGQPMAVSDLQQAAPQASNVAQRLGYAPSSILCAPITIDERVVGVLELVDRQDAASFAAADLEALGLFARVAASTITQSHAQANLVMLVADVLSTASQEAVAGDATLQGFTSTVQADPAYRDALDLAGLVQNIVRHGEVERHACRQILQTFADFLQSQAGQASDFGSPS